MTTTDNRWSVAERWSVVLIIALFGSIFLGAVLKAPVPETSKQLYSHVTRQR